MCGIDRLVILAEELLVFSLGEVSQDHERIGGVFRRLCGRVTQRAAVRRRVCQSARAIDHSRALSCVSWPDSSHLARDSSTPGAGR